MMILCYFILGILFYQVFCPIIDSTIGLFCTWLELKKQSLINKHHKEFEESPQEETHAIGFCIDTTEEEEEEYDE